MPCFEGVLAVEINKMSEKYVYFKHLIMKLFLKMPKYFQHFSKIHIDITYNDIYNI